MAFREIRGPGGELIVRYDPTRHTIEYRARDGRTLERELPPSKAEVKEHLPPEERRGR